MRGKGFQFANTLGGESITPLTLDVLAKASVAFEKGDAVRINTSGHVDVADANEAIAGIVLSVVDKYGTRVDNDANALDTWTMDSDNVTDTDKNYQVRFIPALANYLFYNDADGDLAQTNLLQYFDLADHTQVQQSSASDTAPKQVRLVAIDPDGDGDASKGLFQIIESQFAQAAAVDNAA